MLQEIDKPALVVLAGAASLTKYGFADYSL
jgi:hypothetical protein